MSRNTDTNNSQKSGSGSQSSSGSQQTSKDSVGEAATKAAIDNTVNTVASEIGRWFHGK